ncbi:MAG: FKBP-type peptidyl-prolyl cis-trans isomerase [Ectothiorhodospiraceae bacterium]|nr:FKBP-type peptidyl-prolyl cis-trans isomerase [Ectothiorhodospiraceae bacterium]
MSRRLAIRYTLYLSDGTEVENNLWEAPLVYREGSGELLPALDEALRGIQPGTTQRVELSAEQAYGPRDEDALQTVSLFELPTETRHEGAMLTVGDDAGHYLQARVVKIEGEYATLDLNHPLAGQDLVFEVDVLEAEDD